VSADYDHGRRDGLRLALAILAAEEARSAPLLGDSLAWRTTKGREVRRKSFQVAQKRIQTVLGKFAADDRETVLRGARATRRSWVCRCHVRRSRDAAARFSWSPLVTPRHTKSAHSAPAACFGSSISVRPSTRQGTQSSP